MKLPFFDGCKCSSLLPFHQSIIPQMHLLVQIFINPSTQTMFDICYFTIKVSVRYLVFFFQYLIISLMYKIIHRLFTVAALNSVCAHCASRYASQSSSSALEWRTGSGGMASDILAKAPPEPLWTSPASPPAGPFPDIPAAWTLCVNRQPAPASVSLNQSVGSPFRRMASLLKRSDMKSPPLDAAATAARPNTHLQWSALVN